MSVELCERAAAALGPLLPEATFVGGATIGLWLSDQAAALARPTNDVDVVVEISSRPALHAFEARLRAQGFREDAASGVICRWNHGERDDPLVVDVMPTDASILGFANIWQARAVPVAQLRALPSGSTIRATPPPYLIATKLEAFRGRGSGAYGVSHDIEDIITLVDGRAEVVVECGEASRELREYVGTQVRSLLGDARFVDELSWHLRADLASQARAEAIVLPRLQALAGLAP